MTKYFSGFFQNFYGTFIFFKKIKWPTRDAATLMCLIDTLYKPKIIQGLTLNWHVRRVDMRLEGEVSVLKIHQAYC